MAETASPKKKKGQNVEVETQRTEYEFFRGCEHVERKCHFVLVAFPLQPAEEGGRVIHSLLRRGAGSGRALGSGTAVRSGCLFGCEKSR